jgi:hypothetical protein
VLVKADCVMPGPELPEKATRLGDDRWLGPSADRRGRLPKDRRPQEELIVNAAANMSQPNIRSHVSRSPLVEG